MANALDVTTGQLVATVPLAPGGIARLRRATRGLKKRVSSEDESRLLRGAPGSGGQAEELRRGADLSGEWRARALGGRADGPRGRARRRTEPRQDDR